MHLSFGCRVKRFIQEVGHIGLSPRSNLDGVNTIRLESREALLNDGRRKPSPAEVCVRAHRFNVSKPLARGLVSAHAIGNRLTIRRDHHQVVVIDMIWRSKHAGQATHGVVGVIERAHCQRDSAFKIAGFRKRLD